MASECDDPVVMADPRPSTLASGSSALLAAVPAEVSLYEVSPRDGLQNEPTIVPTEGKVELIHALFAAGLGRVEVSSFVSPKWVPQLADAQPLIAQLQVPRDGQISALVPNERGLERALTTGLSEVAVFMSASETHNRTNTNKSIDASLGVFGVIVPEALRHKLRVRAYVSTVWGCPYEGEIDLEVTARIVKKLVELGCYEVSLGDTIGVGTPRRTAEVVSRLIEEVGSDRLALHFHDTRGTALANALMGLELGIRSFDASVGGLGGCPYAPGASGNLATEDLVYMLEGMGVRTGVSLEKLLDAARVAETVVGRSLPSKVLQAGPYKLRKMP